MEKDLKDKKQEEKNTPKIPWTKLVPAAAVIAALVFSGIKAKGSDGETEAVGQAETTVMSASELEKYLGYEKENTVFDSTTATAEKNSTTKKKSSSKKSAKKNSSEKKLRYKNGFRICKKQFRRRRTGNHADTGSKRSGRWI